MTDREAQPHPNGQRRDDHLSAVGLTEMEERIFAGLAAGMTRGEICREQGIGHTAYDNYLRMARRYLGVRTPVEAVVIYVRDKRKEEQEHDTWPLARAKPRAKPRPAGR